MDGLGRAFDGADVALTLASGEVEIGSTYPDPPDATMTRIRGVFNFTRLRMAYAEKGKSFCYRVPASSRAGD